MVNGALAAGKPHAAVLKRPAPDQQPRMKAFLESIREADTVASAACVPVSGRRSPGPIGADHRSYCLAHGPPHRPGPAHRPRDGPAATWAVAHLACTATFRPEASADTGPAPHAAGDDITGRSACACPITRLNSHAHKIIVIRVINGSPKPFGRITLDIRVIIARVFDPICGDDHPYITRLGYSLNRSCPAQSVALGRSDLAELHSRPGPMTFSYRSCSAYVNSPDGAYQSGG